MARGFLSSFGSNQPRWNTEIDETNTAAQEPIGAVRFENNGRIFRYGQTADALVAGNPVAFKSVLAYDVNSDVTTGQSAAGEDTLISTGAFSSLTVSEDNTFVMIDAQPGAGQVRVIDSVVDDDTIKVTEAWTTALHTSSDFIVYKLWGNLQKAAVGQLAICGVAQSTFSANDYGWFLMKGHGLVLVDGSESPLVAGEKFVGGAATAGTVEGFTAGATTADEAARTIGTAIADTGALDVTAHALIDCAWS